MEAQPSEEGVMPINWSSFSSDTSFNALTGDFSKLEIRQSENDPAFHYFYDVARRALVTDFILDGRPQVETRCTVTLIEIGDSFSPRLRFWKRDKSKPGKQKLVQEVTNSAEMREVKAVVDTADAREGFWKLIAFIQGFVGIELPDGPFRVVPGNEAELAEILQGAEKSAVIGAVRSALGGSLTEQDIQLLADRKGQLDEFEKLLGDENHFALVQKSIGDVGRERVWQDFFERNPWILGYGLHLVSCDPLDKDRLEQITSGAGIFGGAGKRVDALLKTRGYIGSLVFCEFKHHETDLLVKPYRPPDVYQISKELSGGVLQIQKTVHKAVAGLKRSIEQLEEPDGTPTAVEFSIVRPRQVLVIGSLRQLMVGDQINSEMSLTFELYRRSIHDVEIITFDELFQRAQYIVGEVGGR